MKKSEAVETITLLATLWTSYKIPKDEEIDVAANIWLNFFGHVPAATVQQTIFEIAAEGGEFPPQVGQIYNRLKQKRTMIAAPKINETMYINCLTYAKVAGISPPNRTDDLATWFREAKNAVC